MVSVRHPAYGICVLEQSSSMRAWRNSKPTTLVFSELSWPSRGHGLGLELFLCRIVQLAEHDAVNRHETKRKRNHHNTFFIVSSSLALDKL